MARVMLGLVGLLCFCPLGCKKTPPAPANEVVIYADVDAAVAKPILGEFQKQTGVAVKLQMDATGAVLRAGHAKPAGDVWWSQDCWTTMGLAEAGILAGYESAATAQIPKEFKDGAGRWAGTGLRWRVLAVTRRGDGAPLAGTVHRLADLADPPFAGRVGIAHAADFSAYAALWGDAQSRDFFRGLHDNDARLLGGDALAQAVGQGALWAGYCDACEVAKAKTAGGKLDAVWPDQDGAGMLMVPYSVALVAGAAHSQQARLLIDYLLSRAVERKLLEAGLAQSSVFEGQSSPRRMSVDWNQANQKWPAIQKESGALRGQ